MQGFDQESSRSTRPQGAAAARSSGRREQRPQGAAAAGSRGPRGAEGTQPSRAGGEQAPWSRTCGYSKVRSVNMFTIVPHCIRPEAIVHVQRRGRKCLPHLGPHAEQQQQPGRGGRGVQESVVGIGAVGDGARLQTVGSPDGERQRIGGQLRLVEGREYKDAASAACKERDWWPGDRTAERQWRQRAVRARVRRDGAAVRCRRAYCLRRARCALGPRRAAKGSGAWRGDRREAPLQSARTRKRPPL